MNWSRTKLIFLVAFLILDLYLGFQLYDKRKNADLLTVSGKESPKETLSGYQINYPSNLPQIESATYIKGETMSFVTQPESPNSDSEVTNTSVENKQNTKKKAQLKPEIKELQFGQQGQRIQKITAGPENTVIYSELSEPIPVPENGDFTAFRETYVYKGSEYQLWKEERSDAVHSYIFVQTYNERPVFSKGQNLGALQVFVNNGQIVRYRQIYLKIEPYKKEEKKDIITQINALYNLYENNHLPYDSTVKVVKLGYYNLIGRDLGNVKLFVPAWHVLVKSEESDGDKVTKEYFVNAITGIVQTLEEPEEETEETTG